MSSISFDPSSSLLAQRIFQANISFQSMSLNKLATGLRINRGADDPAGLISSENLRSVLKSLEAESRAARRTEQTVNVADGALGSVSDLLGDANALVVRNANTAGMSAAEREANQLELDSILSTVNRIASTTSFNGDRLLDGTASMTVAGATVTIDEISTGSLGTTESGGESYTLSDLKAGGRLDLVGGDLELAQQVIATASTEVTSQRGELGAFVKNTIGARLDSLVVAFENITAAESQIRDLDYAAEFANYSRLQVLVASAGEALRLTGAQQLNVLNLLA